MENWEPPLYECYQRLERVSSSGEREDEVVVEECNVPVIDLRRLRSEREREREACKEEIAEAAREWGLLQVVGHGISPKVLHTMKKQQVNLFRQPFHAKASFFDAGAYRWGSPSATRLSHFSWSEVFHVPLTNISFSPNSSLRSSMEEFGGRVSDLAQKVAEILSEKIGQDSSFFEENCSAESCYIRMNRYPPCPVASRVMGIAPHTDSDFLTILYQDQVGGLQLVKDATWFAVKPNPKALIINVGDLFQAWSNGVYKSVEHRVVGNPYEERFSTAYFFCPSYDAVIQSCFTPSIYKSFSFREYREQVQQDVRTMGFKVGLSRFLI